MKNKKNIFIISSVVLFVLISAGTASWIYYSNKQNDKAIETSKPNEDKVDNYNDIKIYEEPKIVEVKDEYVYLTVFVQGDKITEISSKYVKVESNKVSENKGYVVKNLLNTENLLEILELKIENNKAIVNISKKCLNSKFNTSIELSEMYLKIICKTIFENLNISSVQFLVDSQSNMQGKFFDFCKIFNKNADLKMLISQEEAINIVKKAFVNGSNYNVILESIDSKGNYVIAIQRKSDTVIGSRYYVDSKTGKFTYDPWMEQ